MIKEKWVRLKKSIDINGDLNKTLQNFNWLISNRIITMIIGMFVMAIIARYFGPDKYGQFNYALAYTSFFIALSTLGFETLAVKAIIDREYDEGTILFTSFTLRFFAGIILSILALIIIILIEPEDNRLHLLVLIMLITVIIKSTDVIEYWTHAYQRAKISSSIQMISYILAALLKITLVLLGGTLVHLALIYLIEALIIAGGYIGAYVKKRTNKSEFQFNKKFAKGILSKSWYLVISSLLVTIYMKIDQVMLGSMLVNKSELGVYSAAAQIAIMWYFVPIAIITSFKPIILHKKQNQQETYITTVKRLYSIIGWVSISFAIFIFLFSDIIINILYGVEFLGASNILSISIWAGVFAMLGNVTAIWLVCEDLHKYKTIFVLSGAIVNIVLNVITIPKWGAYGAAIATLVAQFIANFATPLLFKDVRISSILMLKSIIRIRKIK